MEESATPYDPRMLSPSDIDLIRLGRHGDPFAVLGPHRDATGQAWVRAFLPGATAVAVRFTS